MRNRLGKLADVKAVILEHPAVVSRLAELEHKISVYESRTKSRYEQRHAATAGYARISDSPWWKLDNCRAELEQILSGGPCLNENPKDYLRRCAAILIEILFQLEDSGDMDSALHNRLARTLESVNADLSTAEVNIRMSQTVNVMALAIASVGKR